MRRASRELRQSGSKGGVVFSVALLLLETNDGRVGSVKFLSFCIALIGLEKSWSERGQDQFKVGVL